jgi:hypothetical protein
MLPGSGAILLFQAHPRATTACLRRVARLGCAGSRRVDRGDAQKQDESGDHVECVGKSQLRLNMIN